MQNKVSAAIAGSAVLTIAAGLLFFTKPQTVRAENEREFPVLYVSNFTSNEITAYNAVSGKYLGVVVKGGSELQGANGITVGAEGDIFVAGQYSNNVLRYDAENGRLKGALDPQNSAGISSPQGVEFGPDGLLYAASYDNDKLVRYDTRTHNYAGTLCNTTLPGVQHMGPIHPVFGHDNNLYIGTFDGHVALKYQGPLPAAPGNSQSILGTSVAAAVSSPGTLLTVFSAPPAGASVTARSTKRMAAGTPAFGTVDTSAYASGTLAPASASAPTAGATTSLSDNQAAATAPQHYYVDFIDPVSFTGQVLEYTADGQFVKSFVPTGTGGLVLPGGIGIGPDGNLYVANIKVDQNFQDIGSEILRFDIKTGQFLNKFVTAGKGLNVPFAMAFATRTRPLNGRMR